MKQQKHSIEIIVPIITPCKNGVFDEASFLTHHAYLEEQGIKKMFVLGHTGEFEHIPYEQKRTIIEVALREEKKRENTWIGVTGETMNETLVLARHAEDKGAKQIVFAPTYIGMTQAQEADHFFANRKSKVFLYNNPKAWRGQRYIPEKWIDAWAEEGKIAGIKDSSGNKTYLGLLEQIARSANGALQIYQGAEQEMPRTLTHNLAGIVAGTANLDPQLFLIWLNNPTRFLWEQIDQQKRIAKAVGKGNYVAGIKKVVHASLSTIASEEMYKK